jgi:hypothetical protein
VTERLGRKEGCSLVDRQTNDEPSIACNESKPRKQLAGDAIPMIRAEANEATSRASRGRGHLKVRLSESPLAEPSFPQSPAYRPDLIRVVKVRGTRFEGLSSQGFMEALGIVVAGRHGAKRFCGCQWLECRDAVGLVDAN